MSATAWCALKIRLAVKTATLGGRVTAFLDAVLVSTIVIALSMAVTGPVLHEWLGLLAAVLLLVHVLRRWPWFALALRRPAGVRARAALALYAILFIDVVLVLFSGALISQTVLPAIGGAASANFAWHRVHSLSQHLLMLLVGLHLAFNWQRVRPLLTVLVSCPGAPSTATVKPAIAWTNRIVSAGARALRRTMRVLLTGAMVAGAAYLIVPQRTPSAAAPDRVAEERLARPGSVLALAVLLRTIGIIGATAAVARPFLQPRPRLADRNRAKDFASGSVSKT